MKNTGTLKVTTPTDREIVLTRVFDAPRRLVFDAFTKPGVAECYDKLTELLASAEICSMERGGREV